MLAIGLFLHEFVLQNFLQCLKNDQLSEVGTLDRVLKVLLTKTLDHLTRNPAGNLAGNPTGNPIANPVGTGYINLKSIQTKQNIGVGYIQPFALFKYWD